MPLSDDQQKWLSDFFDKCEADAQKLTEWEAGFIMDQQRRFEQYGATMFLSEKQAAVLRRVEKKLDGEEDER